MDALEEQADTAADFVEDLLAKMDIDATAEPNLANGHMYVDIVGDDEDDMALLIGRHGETLEAIQELTRMVVGRRLDERCRVIVDVEDYRKRREERMIERALRGRPAGARDGPGRGAGAHEPLRAQARARRRGRAGWRWRRAHAARSPNRFVVIRRR